MALVLGQSARILFLFLFLLIWKEAKTDNNPYDNLLTLVSGGDDKLLTRDELMRIVTVFKERFPASQCFVEDTLGVLLKNKAQERFSREEFGEISTTLVYFASKKNCSLRDANAGNAKKSLLRGDSLTLSTAQEIVNALASNDYHADDDTDTCFNGQTVYEEGLDTEEFFMQLVEYVYQGRCILPTPDYFKHELFELIGASENGTVSKEAFGHLLEEIGIGEVVDGHGHESEGDHGHGDDEENHDDGDAHEDDHEHDTEVDEHEHGEDEHGDEDHGSAGSSRCYSGDELLDIYGVTDNNLTSEKLIEMCPALVQQLVSRACTEKSTSDGDTTDADYTTAMVYGYGTAAVAIISLLALGGMLVFPILNSSRYQLAMQFFVSLGVGTMAADALLHIIPYILGLHSHSDEGDEHDHEEDMSYVWKLSAVLGGIYLFYLFENGMRLWKRSRRHEIQPGSSVNGTYQNKMSEAGSELDRTGCEHTMTSFCREEKSREKNEIEDGVSDITVSDEMLAQNDVVCYGLTTVCLMIFIGDVLHNFADGLSIGVAFTISWPTGVGTSLAIFCHELPHEFGDFAIYLNNGASKWKAILFNVCAACCAFIGLYIGINAAQEEVARQWIMSAIAGMFLYISLVDVLHEMMTERTSSPKLQFFLQNLGLLMGWAILLVLALYEEDIQSSIT